MVKSLPVVVIRLRIRPLPRRSCMSVCRQVFVCLFVERILVEAIVKAVGKCICKGSCSCKNCNTFLLCSDCGVSASRKLDIFGESSRSAFYVSMFMCLLAISKNTFGSKDLIKILSHCILEAGYVSCWKFYHTFHASPMTYYPKNMSNKHDPPKNVTLLSPVSIQ